MVIVADRQWLRVAPGAIGCDAPAFEAAARAGARAAALALYRGPLLPGYFDDWVVEERRRLETLAEALSEAPVAAAAAAEGAAPAPVGAVAPDVAPTRPFEAATIAAAAARALLPNYLTRLYGVDALVDRIAATLREQRLVCLLGPGGAGKTRLAVEAARRSCDERRAPFDLVAFVPWIGCTTAAEVLDRTLLALRLGGGGGEPVPRLLAALGGRRVLLVLDNCEQIDAAARAAVADWLAALAGLHVLATSRRPLGLDGEHCLPLPPLPVPPATAALGESALNPAVALFVDRARAARADFKLHAANQGAITALVTLLDGHPLAIELAAARVRALPPAQLVERLQTARSAPPGGGAPGLQLLARAGPRAGGDPRHASMEAVIDWSYRLLDPAARALLHRLCCVGAPLRLATLLAVEGDAAVPTLDSLLGDSLLRVHEGRDGEPRWSVHELVREFVRARLGPQDAAGLAAPVRAAVLGWARGLPATVPLPQAREELALVLWSLGDALQAGAPRETLELALALAPLWSEMAMPAGGVAHVQRALEQLDDADARSRTEAADATDDETDDETVRGARALAVSLVYEAGDRPGAARWAARAEAALPHQPAARAGALHHIARWHLRAGRDAAAATARIDAALPLARAAGARRIEGGLWSLRATIASLHDRDQAAAARCGEEAAAAFADAGNRHGVHSARYNLALIDIEAGRHADALARLDSLPEALEALGDHQLLAGVCNARASALSRLDRLPEAIAHARRSLALAWSAAETEDVVYALWNLAPMLLKAGAAADAARAMAAAERVWRTQFGELTADEQRDVHALREAVALQVGAGAGARAWRAGQDASLADAVRTALAARAAD
jgi:predicted ATPase